MGLKKGQTNNKKGRPKGALSSKRKEWEEMGHTLTTEWTQYIVDEGNRMIKEKRFEDFYAIYKDLVQYFKPKQTHNINEDKTPPKIVFQNVSEQFTFDSNGKPIKNAD